MSLEGHFTCLPHVDLGMSADDVHHLIDNLVDHHDHEEREPAEYNSDRTTCLKTTNALKSLNKTYNLVCVLNTSYVLIFNF